MKNLMLIVILFLFSFSAFSQTDKKDDSQNQGSGTGQGSGSGSGSGSSDEDKSSGEDSKVVKSKPAKNSALRIISKPPARYTDVARSNQVNGKVVLQVTFMKNGEIGTIQVISGLPDGLTEQAVEAAKRIKFEPERKNGKPKTIKKNVEYSFTIY